MAGQGSSIKPTTPYISCVSNQTLSYFILFFASFFIVFSFIYSNQNNISVMETSLSRYSVQIILSYIICRANKCQMIFENSVQMRKLIFRSMIFTMNTAVLAWAQFYLPLYVVHTIGSMGPVFVCIINYYVNNIKISKNQINGNIFAFVGIFFTINGKSISSMFWEVKFHSQFQNYKSDSQFVMFLVSLIVLTATFFWSYGVATTRHCISSIPEIIHHQSVMGMILASFSYMFVSNPVNPEIFFKSLLFVGFMQALAIILFNFAIYIATNTNLTSIMVQNVILVSYFIGIFRYHQEVDYICLFGTILLIVGVTIVILSK